MVLSVIVEEEKVLYRVKDNGLGMDPAVSRVLFKEFITTKGTRGTGFGLMTTKKIIDAHGGQIVFDSQKGCGSVFTICLPATCNDTGE